MQIVKNLPAMQETQDRSLGQDDPLEKGMATHSSILVWIASCWPRLESSGVGWSSPGGPLPRLYENHVMATRASNEKERKYIQDGSHCLYIA